MKTYRKRILTLGLLLVMVFGLLGQAGLRPDPVLAQSYSFSVPELKMQVYVQADASIKIIYDITFKNSAFGHEIDIVDIGMPNGNYDISNMQASINGVNLNTIRKSDYIDVGVEVHLKSETIPAGESGTLHFEFTMPDMIYQDTTDKAYASLRITPTWFDADSVEGTTNIQIAIHMLESVSPDEMRFQSEAFSNKLLYEGRAVAVWQWPNGKADKAYPVGVSFPQTGMTRVIEMTLFDLAREFLKDNPGVYFLLIAASAILFCVLFFRFSGGTGFSVFVVLGAGVVFVLIVAPLTSLLLPFPLVFMIFINEITMSKRRKQYLPPIAQVEGGGIKRGLTAPEAATLLNMPLNKVLTLVVFGLLQKGVLEQVQSDPLIVEMAEAFDSKKQPSEHYKKRTSFRRYVAQQTGTVIHSYEQGFLDEIEEHAGQPISKIKFSKPMQNLIKVTVAKMKGFDLSDTKEYYQRVIDRAMKQAAGLGEIEQREEYLDKYLPWVMMNDNPAPIFQHRGYSYWPRWVRRRSSSSMGGGGKSSGGQPAFSGRTSMGDVAASFAGWAENTMGGLAATILPGSMSLPGAKGGFVDLSGADRVTGDVFEALAKAAAENSSSSGGGGGSSCACACAGCACACACAGGGR